MYYVNAKCTESRWGKNPAYITPLPSQQIECHSYPSGHGFCLTHIKPGQVYSFKYFDIDSSKTDIHDETKFSYKLSFHSSYNCHISQNQSRWFGGSILVSLSTPKIISNQCVVAISNHKPKNLSNSPYVISVPSLPNFLFVSTNTNSCRYVFGKR